MANGGYLARVGLGFPARRARIATRTHRGRACAMHSYGKFHLKDNSKNQ